MKLKFTVVDVDGVAAKDINSVVAGVLKAMGQPAPEPRTRVTVEEEDAALGVVPRVPTRTRNTRICTGCGANRPYFKQGQLPKCPHCGGTGWEQKGSLAK